MLYQTNTEFPSDMSYIRCSEVSPLQSITCRCPALPVLRYRVLTRWASALGSGKDRFLCVGLLCPVKHKKMSTMSSI